MRLKDGILKKLIKISEIITNLHWKAWLNATFIIK